MKPDYRVKVAPENLGTLLVCAQRYAMGRQTYMPSLIQDVMKQHWKDLAAGVRTTLRRDLHEAITRDAPLGASFDHEGWVQMLAWMDANTEETDVSTRS